MVLQTSVNSEGEKLLRFRNSQGFRKEWLMQRYTELTLWFLLTAVA